MGGGKLLDDTTYKQYYRLRTEGFKAPQPVIQKEYFFINTATVFL